MNKILIAVDDTKSSRKIFSQYTNICKQLAPDEIILLYVEKFCGASMLTEMLGDAELSTLKEVLEGSEYKDAMDKKAVTILDFYKRTLEEGSPGPNVRTMIKIGHPAEEIVETAKEEDVSLIFIGSRSQRDMSLFIGSISREVVNTADRSVLVVK